jgi:hypothetical protein
LQCCACRIRCQAAARTAADSRSSTCCISADNPNRYPTPISSHDYLMERLREIKLV